MIGVYKCPGCGVEQGYRGRCPKCRKAAKKSARAEDRARVRMKVASDKGMAKTAALQAIKAILSPFVTKCARCERPGKGFKSKRNPDGLEAHHPFRRRGYWFFIVVPLCHRCHEEVEQHGDQAREDRWLIKEPIKRR